MGEHGKRDDGDSPWKVEKEIAEEKKKATNITPTVEQEKQETRKRARKEKASERDTTNVHSSESVAEKHP